MVTPGEIEPGTSSPEDPGIYWDRVPGQPISRLPPPQRISESAWLPGAVEKPIMMPVCGRVTQGEIEPVTSSPEDSDPEITVLLA